VRPVVVVDTNVLVSGLFRHPSPSRQILHQFREEAFTLAMSPSLLGELVEVVTRPSLKRLIPRETIEELLENIREDAFLIQPTQSVRVVAADPDDDRVFACALAAEAGCIVSGDRAVLAIERFRGIPVLTPRAFLAWLASH
jgi:putative PIN family toxin of toxin-antitoxin system